MYKTILLITLVCFCFLTSCRSKRQETQKVETTIETNHEKIVTYKDTILFTPKSETSLKIPTSDLVFKPSLNKVEKPKIFTQKNGNATAKVRVVLDSIFITATCDSLTIAAKIKTKFEKEYWSKEKADQSKINSQTGWTLFDLFVAVIVGFVICYVLKLFKIV
jgi:hypothetical protein